MPNSITFYLNGKLKHEADFEPNMTLLQYLRTPTLAMTGTKEGCGAGSCGACSVMMASYNAQKKSIQIDSIKSCCFPLIFCHGTAIFTIEGNNTTLNRKLNKVQETFIKHEAGQCGYCIPGMIMSTSALLHRRVMDGTGAPSHEDIEEMMSGHFCRCTGYRPQALALDDIIEQAKKGPILEPIQYPEDIQPASTETVCIKGKGFDFYVPSTKEELIQCWAQSPKAHILGGCTHSIPIFRDYSYVQAEHDAGNDKITVISTRRVSDLKGISVEGNSLSLGASVTVTELLEYARVYAKDHPNELSTLPLLARLLPRLRSLQLRTVSTVVGEILGYSEIGALLMGLGVSVTSVTLNEDGSASAPSTRIPISTPCSCGCGTKLGLKKADEASSSSSSSSSSSASDDATTEYIATSLCAIDCKENLTHPVLVLSLSLPLHNLHTPTSLSFCEAHFTSRRHDNFVPLFLLIFTGTLSLTDNQWKFSSSSVVLSDGRGHIDRESRVSDGVRGASTAPSAQGVSSQTERELTNPSLRRFPHRPISVIHYLPQTSAYFTDTSAPLTTLSFEKGTEIMEKEVEAVMNGAHGISNAEKEFAKACAELTTSKPPVPTSILNKHYIITAAPQLLTRFAHRLAHSLSLSFSSGTSDAEEEEAEHLFDFHGEEHKWQFNYEKVDTVMGSVHSNMHLPSHVAGMTKYTIDFPIPASGLHGALVLSTIAHGKIISIDASEALRTPGVFDVVTAKDIPGINKHTGIVMDTKVFADEEVECMHQPIGLVVATSPEVAEYAAKNQVKVKYEELPSILTIEEAYAKKSFLSMYEDKFIEIGDIDGCMAHAKEMQEKRALRKKKIENGEELTEEEKKEAEQDEAEGELVIVSGEVKCGGQDHFYGETQNCVVIPLDDTVEVYSSTQNPSKVQFDVAGALGIPRAKVTCRAMRVGGGFGGKQDRPCIFATAAAIAAYKTGRPVKLVMHRAEDMKVHGGRHPIWCRYSIVVQSKKEHKIQGMLVENISHGGYAHDTTGPVLFKCMFQIQSVYTIPNIRSIARATKTNHNPNTAFRGFGAPQATFFMEMIMDHVADVLGIDQLDFRTYHLNYPGDPLLSGSLLSQKKGEKFIRIMWDDILKTADYRRREEAVDRFNATHTTLKRGIAITPMKNGCCFEDDFMNQAECLIHVLPDGSVEVAHSGIEMGQGLNTKVAQCVAETLGVDLSFIHVYHTSTETCANTQPTAASSGLDVNGGAAVAAAKKLREQLRPLREKFPDKSWPDFCTTCYFIRTNMSAQSHFVLPPIGWDWNTKSGYTAFYYAFGVGVSEVEFDTTTGEFKILRTDLYEDAGRSMNPLLDAGQIEGGFVQGLGWMMGEEIEYDITTGAMLTDSSTYAIPYYRDVPLDLRTTIPPGFRCPENVGASKTTAESPLVLSVSVLMALRHAINAARLQRGLPLLRYHISPLTVERAKLAADGKIDQLDNIPYTTSL